MLLDACNSSPLCHQPCIQVIYCYTIQILFSFYLLDCVLVLTLFSWGHINVHILLFLFHLFNIVNVPFNRIGTIYLCKRQHLVLLRNSVYICNNVNSILFSLFILPCCVRLGIGLSPILFRLHRPLLYIRRSMMRPMLLKRCCLLTLHQRIRSLLYFFCLWCIGSLSSRNGNQEALLHNLLCSDGYVNLSRS